MSSSGFKREPKRRIVSEYYYFGHFATDHNSMGRMDLDLQVAWNTINLISREYNYMWDRLEKLELLLYQQQNVIAQLLSALITSYDAEYTVEKIDFIYEDIGQIALRYDHNEGPVVTQVGSHSHVSPSRLSTKK